MNMNKFGPGIVAGLVIGSVVGMSVKKNSRQANNIKRNVGKTLRTIGNMVDSYR